MKYVFMFVVVAAWLMALLVSVWASVAEAHDWYPISCCHQRDCFPLAFDEVEITQEGYKLPSGEIIPFDKARQSPDEHDNAGEKYHMCTPQGTRDETVRRTWDSKTKQSKPCFWAPQMGLM